MDTKTRPQRKRKVLPNAHELANAGPPLNASLFELDGWFIDLAAQVRARKVEPLQAILAAAFMTERRQSHREYSSHPLATSDALPRCQRLVAGRGTCGMLLGAVTGTDEKMCMRCDAEHLSASEGSAA